MASELSLVYAWVARLSRYATGVVAVAMLITHIFGGSLSISVQLVLALIGLAIGIPHGAIDHLISIPSHPRTRFALYIVGYILIAVIAGLAIATWNVIAFDLVLIMSGLHFGFGDASFMNEARSSDGGESEPLWVEILYALPAGFLPVILPLTDSRTTSALSRIRGSLVQWSGTYGQALRSVTLVFAIIALIAFMTTKRYLLAVDLTLLAILSIAAPPLVAFATYFGFWHAQRHTARLVPRLPRALLFAHNGNPLRSFLAAVTPGLYAVIGSFALAVTLMVLSPSAFSSSLLWSVLVIIWALTVPHMLSTARLDKASLKGTFRPN